MILKVFPVFIFFAAPAYAQKEAPSKEEMRVAIETAMKKEDLPGAEKVFTEWIDSGAGDFDAFSGRAAIRLLSGNAKGSQEDFAAAEKLDAEKGAKLKFFIADRAMWKARKLGMDGKQAEALKIYDSLIALYPKSGSAYHDRGGVKTALKNYDGAIADLTKAIEFDDGNNAFGDSYILRARAKRAKGDEEDAKEDETKANAVAEARSQKEDGARGSGEAGAEKEGE